MRFLVSGGSGFIGTNLIRFLLSQPDFQVFNIDRLTYAGQSQSLSSFANDARYRFLQCDIRDARQVLQGLIDFAPDAIIHLAAESHVDRSIDSPATFIESNIDGTFRMLEASLAYWRHRSESPFRFVHVSTDEVFGSLTSAQPRFTEDQRYDPHSPYAASKAASDHLVQAWHATYGLPTILMHASNNYGPYQFPEKLIPTVIVRGLQHMTIPIYGKGENIRDWMHVEDHCRAILAVAVHGRIGASYNVGAQQERTNLEVVRSVCHCLERLEKLPEGSIAQRIEFVEDRPGHDLRYGVDATQIQRELGWHPGVPFDWGLQQTVEWYWKNQDWWKNILAAGHSLARRGLPPNPSNSSMSDQR